MTTINTAEMRIQPPSTGPLEVDNDLVVGEDLLEEMIKKKMKEFNFGLFYNQWVQKVMLSDGLDEDENHDW